MLRMDFVLYRSINTDEKESKVSSTDLRSMLDTNTTYCTSKVTPLKLE